MLFTQVSPESAILCDRSTEVEMSLLRIPGSRSRLEYLLIYSKQPHQSDGGDEDESKIPRRRSDWNLIIPKELEGCSHPPNR